MRSVMAVILGYVLWTALWLAGNGVMTAAGMLPGDAMQPIHALRPLLGLLALGSICSLSAGYLTAAVTRSTSTVPAVVLGLSLLGSGAFVESAVWHLMPVWYHVVFLGMLIPATLLGRKLRQVRQTPSRQKVGSPPDLI